MTSSELVEYIKSKTPKTKAICYIDGYVKEKGDVLVFGSNSFFILIGDLAEIKKILEKNKNLIKNYYLEVETRNSKVDLLDIKNINARIEPGAIIREKVEIKDNAVIMMGAVINIGAKIGKATMIDMNAVIGANAIIGDRCHIGAGSVIAGVLEPPSQTPVVIEDDCLIGAGSVILEGVRIGRNSIVGAGSVVTKDVLPNSVVVGNPARFLKSKDEVSKEKSMIIDDLRK